MTTCVPVVQRFTGAHTACSGECSGELVAPVVIHCLQPHPGCVAAPLTTCSRSLRSQVCADACVTKAGLSSRRLLGSDSLPFMLSLLPSGDTSGRLLSICALRERSGVPALHGRVLLPHLESSQDLPEVWRGSAKCIAPLGHQAGPMQVCFTTTKTRRHVAQDPCAAQGQKASHAIHRQHRIGNRQMCHLFENITASRMSRHMPLLPQDL